LVPLLRRFDAGREGARAWTRSWSPALSGLNVLDRKRYTSGNGRGKTLACRAVYPLSGLIRCGVCGAPMTIYGGSRTAKRYRCTDNAKRGTCSNGLSVVEEVARTAIVSGVRRRLVRESGIEAIRQVLTEEMGRSSGALTGELAERRKRLSRTEGKIRGLIEFIAGGETSSYVIESLRELEAQAKAEKAAIEALVREAREPVALPSTEAVIATVLDMEAAIARDPVAGRERLHRMFKDRRLDLQPVDGRYIAAGSLMPLVAIEIAENDNADPGQDRRYLKGVAGARSALKRFNGFPRFELPFEEFLSI
jgi:hypothetical protein